MTTKRKSKPKRKPRPKRRAASRTHTVYGLASTEPPLVIRYVGQTMRAPAIRLREHHSLARNAKLPVGRWIRQVMARGHDICLIVLEARAERNTAERRWIANLRTGRARLLNATLGSRNA